MFQKSRLFDELVDRGEGALVIEHGVEAVVIFLDHMMRHATTVGGTVGAGQRGSWTLIDANDETVDGLLLQQCGGLRLGQIAVKPAFIQQLRRKGDHFPKGRAYLQKRIQPWL